MELKNIEIGVKMNKKYYILIIFIYVFLVNHSFSQSESFDNFLYEFANNENFQRERVKFPLKLIKVNQDDFSVDTLFVAKNDYLYDKLHYNLLECSEAYTNIYDNFDSKLNDTNERVFRWIGFTDMDVKYYFKRKNGKWYLVRVENIGL